VFFSHSFPHPDTFSPNPTPTILTEHTDWVRDVAFAPNIGLDEVTLASCSQVLHSFIIICAIIVMMGW
jgi:hypothetical protein